MSLELKMVFETSEGKDYTLKLRNVKSTVSSLVPNIMQGIIASNAVATDDGDLLSAKSASIIETTVSSVSL